MVFVLTVDQRGSRSTSDLVPELLNSLNRRPRRSGLLRRFERTAGDEVQGVLSEPRTTIDVIVELLRADSWYVGLGVGEVTEPLPRSTRAGSGEAFVFAREAVTRAKSSPHHVNVVGANSRVAEQVETVLWLMASVLRRRQEEAGRLEKDDTDIVNEEGGRLVQRMRGPEGGLDAVWSRKRIVVRGPDAGLNIRFREHSHPRERCAGEVVGAVASRQ